MLESISEKSLGSDEVLTTQQEAESLLPPIPNRICAATLFSFLWEYSQARAIVSMLSTDGARYVRKGSSFDHLLGVMCIREEDFQSKLAQMHQIYSTIKTIGPK